MAANDDLHVLVVFPLGRDAELIRTALHQAGVQSELLPDVDSAAEALRSRDVGALLVAEEALENRAIVVFTEALGEQPAWSELPVLVLTAGGNPRLKDRQQERRYLPLGHVTLLERPMRIATLVSSVKAALHARRRQYERRTSEDVLRKSDKLAALGRLASTIAHEINNPLEAVGNLLYLLSGTALNQQQRQYLDTAQGELARVTEIAAQTLTFNRQNNIRGLASVSEILDSVLKLFHARLTSSNIAIERRYQNTAPLMCYPGELRQVFANLIGNAFDATRKGGRIVVRERAAAHPKTGQHGIRIVVADTGHGMSAEVKAHLFETFNSTKGNQGTGLGLWISKGIIDKHRGAIHVHSSDKQGSSGTVFSIFLPQDARGALEPPLPLLDNVSL